MEFRLWLEQKMRTEWPIKTNMVHSKEIMPKIDKKRIKEYLHLSRNDERLTTRFVTGHGAFKKHLFNLKISSEDRCRLCKDEKETSRHLLSECDALAVRRFNLFRKSELELVELANVPFRDLIKFVRHKEIINNI